ncbi:(2Fe-2S)-binding protein [Pseudobacteriovorax antillogorgiicola]|uniref:Isoquinoline 1-oxidoreductase, alpha subunit n=1 Tax=Pseudobacteriovorax antillogorgiicola TaxID=1513793 RepID=A0A1Y6C174_9BACT|nr:(2Fe-2S)-binding protein [Pseudobacteriovorax antillogorgiicola]TCS52259.1 isoquinoline 1-oxidoreductase alpha subunit [Pseudobacteriovorax antillogorgiicola]SMF31018.1 isoquinoline 1-oxidoreductase, alpha subunit [Pseudobacteriovorax antillogorgiicola]
MKNISFEFNGQQIGVEAPGDTPLLWVIREELRATGTKFGCGRGLCGSCTVHLNGQAVRSCVMPVSACHQQKVRTIEDLGEQQGHPVQKAWVKHSVPQCGYCQSGQVMQAASLLDNATTPMTESELVDGMSNNLCRCGTYHKIKDAVVEAAKNMGKLK